MTFLKGVKLLLLAVALGFFSANICVDTVFAEETKTEVVTKDNFFNYFDESGEILNSVTADELKFTGSFEGLSISCVIINKAIKVSSDGTLIKDFSIMVTSDNVTIEGFNLSLSSGDFAINVYDSSDVILFNNKIDVSNTSGEYDGYAVLAVDSSNLVVEKNEIKYVGYADEDVYDIENMALKITGDSELIDGINVKENKFDISVPSVPIEYDPNTYLPVVHSAGIYFCGKELLFEDNEVKVKSNGAYGNYDTIYGVYFEANEDDGNIADFTINNNKIEVSGEQYAYAIGMGDNNYFISKTLTCSDNEISVDSKYYSAFLYCDGALDEATIRGNQTAIKSPYSAYGIYFYGYMGAIENVSIKSNKFDLQGSYCLGIGTIINGPLDITDNEIIEKGDILNGMILETIKDDICVSKNKIYAEGTNQLSEGSIWETMAYKYNDKYMSCGIYCKSNEHDITIEATEIKTTGPGVVTETDADIYDNKIETTFDFAVDVNETASYVTDNYLVAGNHSGNGVVIFTDNATVKDNYPEEMGEDVKIELSQKKATYTGKEICPICKVSIGDKVLEENKDYKVSYKDNIHVGNAIVEISGAGGYFGKYTESFQIEPKKVALPEGKNLIFNGKEQLGVPAGEDYTVTGNSGKDAKTYTAVLKLKDKKDYVWNDGKTDDKKISWSIGKAANTLKVSGK
ncbi:MAG: hypothetical protein K6F55_02295, partial [Eubacterium sp.]|nr:hypothetical protein [Eubacterium sp.]